MRAHAPLRAAVGRLMIMPFCKSARLFADAGHDPGHARGHLHVGGMGVVTVMVAGGPVWWACRPDTFWLARWSLSLQPRPSRSVRVVRVARAFVLGHPRPDRFQRGRPRRGGPQAVVSESHPSGESGGTERHRPGGFDAPSRPAWHRRRSSRPARAGRSEHRRRSGGWDQNCYIVCFTHEI